MEVAELSTGAVDDGGLHVGVVGEAAASDVELDLVAGGHDLGVGGAGLGAAEGR